jgi:hypothetical protein
MEILAALCARDARWPAPPKRLPIRGILPSPVIDSEFLVADTSPMRSRLGGMLNYYCRNAT